MTFVIQSVAQYGADEYGRWRTISLAFSCAHPYTRYSTEQCKGGYVIPEAKVTTISRKGICEDMKTDSIIREVEATEDAMSVMRWWLEREKMPIKLKVSRKCDTFEWINNLPNVLELELWRCKITDLTPLTHTLLNVRVLNLSETKVADLTPLRKCVALEQLNLCSCHSVMNWADLSNLTSLKVLYLWSTAVADLTPLARCKALERLWLSGCASVSSLDGLSNLTSLKTLYLECTAVADLTPLAGCTALEILCLTGCKSVSTPAALGVK